MPHGRVRNRETDGRIKKLSIPERGIWNCAVLGCTYMEISRICGISPETLEKNYSDLIKDGYSKLQCSIRRAQIKYALQGQTALLIWLGKIVLHQKEAVDISIGPSDTLTQFMQALRQGHDTEGLVRQAQATSVSLSDKRRSNGETKPVQTAS